MRDIKFRAYIHPYCGYGVPQELYNTMDSTDNYQGDLSEFFGIYNPVFFKIMQYTGLKDKNGVEIYEGDVVKTRTLSDELYENEMQSYSVGFYNGTFCLMKGKQFLRQWKDGTHDWYSLENTESFDIEVIGNIHENPELLKS